VTPPPDSAHRAAERAVRQSYGRLLAIVAARSGDIAGCEDALAEALRAALETWPRSGIPDRPEAWLVTAARRHLGHQRRHGKVREAAQATLDVLSTAHQSTENEPIDERLKLMLVCAHPAIDPAAQAPLMLQTVLGLDAVRIAESFLTSPAAMGQRLVRAKTKIRDARIPFELPDRDQLAPRIGAVLAAIYAAYGTGWEDVLGADPRRKGLAEEAIWLGRVVVGLMPDEPEAKGLLALMLHCESRRLARRDAHGAFVPLQRQDTALWAKDMVAEAEALLAAASGKASLGRFQIEAAIQSVHAQRAVTGVVNWKALILLYDLLLRVAPTLGAMVARAAVLAEGADAQAGLAVLDALSNQTANYQPYWAARGHVLALMDRGAEAATAYRRAAGLSEDPAVRTFLLTAAGATG
jgi:predicted RNA polymerase sigma factor